MSLEHTAEIFVRCTLVCQDKPVSVYKFICIRTVEERMEELVEWKGRLSRNTLRPVDGSQQSSILEGEDEDECKKRGRLSLQDLKKLFEGWDVDKDIL